MFANSFWMLQATDVMRKGGRYIQVFVDNIICTRKICVNKSGRTPPANFHEPSGLTRRCKIPPTGNSEELSKPLQLRFSDYKAHAR